jgi:hypothetical protein
MLQHGGDYFGMILPTLISTFGQVVQLRSILRFHLHLAIFTFSEESAGAIRTGYLVLGFAVVEIASPSLFDCFIDRIDLDTTDSTLHYGSPGSTSILLIMGPGAKKKARELSDRQSKPRSQPLAGYR